MQKERESTEKQYIYHNIPQWDYHRQAGALRTVYTSQSERVVSWAWRNKIKYQVFQQNGAWYWGKSL